MVAATQVAAALTVVKVISAVVVGGFFGVGFHVDWWHHIAPLVVFETDRDTFVSIVGWSSVVTVLAAGVGFVTIGLRSSSVVLCFGWLTGFLAAFELIAADAVMQRLDPPRTSADLLVVATLGCIAGMLVAFAVLGRQSTYFADALRRSTTSPDPLGVRLGAAGNPTLQGAIQ